MTARRALLRDFLTHAGAGGGDPTLPRDYRLLHTSRGGRTALRALHFGLNCISGGNLGLLALWLRRRELAGW